MLESLTYTAGSLRSSLTRTLCIATVGVNVGQIEVYCHD
jgi:hypothetical protein